MNLIVLDTETTDLTKCFCYDLGYRVLNSETGDIYADKHFIIEQVWHNLPLFESAYYKDKRPLYFELMRKHKAAMTKWGYAMRELARDIKKYDVTDAYAYNSDFDDKVIAYNCDWFKCINPLENVPLHDIWGYASQFITNLPEYRAFCETHERFTDTGNYKGSAEVVYQFITDNPTFEEAHMGLMDSDIESMILFHCIDKGAKWGQDYKVNKILSRIQEKPFTIKVDGEEVYSGNYIKKYVRNDVFSFTTGG
jgi:hypothetical protein